MVADVLLTTGAGTSNRNGPEIKADFLRLTGLLRHAPAVSFDEIIFKDRPLAGASAGKTFAQEAEPLLQVVHEALLEAQKELPGSKLWQNLKIHLARISFNQPGLRAISARDIYASDHHYNSSESSGTQIFIDLRRFAKPKIDPEVQKSKLKDSLLKELRIQANRIDNPGFKDDEIVFLDGNSPSGQVPLEVNSKVNALTGGYELLHIYEGSLPAAKRTKQMASTCLAPKLHTYVANRLKELSTQFGEVQVVEIGAYDGTGIPETLAETRRVHGRPLTGLSYYVSDPSAVGLKHAKERLQAQELHGAEIHYVQDRLDFHPLENLRSQGFNGRGYMFRANNVLDALPSNFIAKIDGEPYKVGTKTFIEAAALSKRLQSPIAFTLEGTESSFVPSDKGITSEYLIEILKRGDHFTAEEIVRDIHMDRDIPFEAAVQLWGEVLSFIHRDISYVKINNWEDYPWAKTEEGRNLNCILASVFKDIPEGYLMPDNVAAVNLLLNYLPAIHSGGHIISAQLTCGHESYQGPRTLGITRAQGLYAPIMDALVKELGHTISWKGAKEFDLTTPSSSVFDIRIN